MSRHTYRKNTNKNNSIKGRNSKKAKHSKKKFKLSWAHAIIVVVFAIAIISVAWNYYGIPYLDNLGELAKPGFAVLDNAAKLYGTYQMFKEFEKLKLKKKK